MLAVLIVVVTIFLIVRQLRRQHDAARRRLEREEPASRHRDQYRWTQALLLFDASARLVICNQQYIDMFGLSPDVAKPGCHLRDLILHRQETGSFVGDVDEYCARFTNSEADKIRDITWSTTPDGRNIHLIYRRSPDGGWATTLEDVTDGRRAQAQDRISRALRRADQICRTGRCCSAMRKSCCSSPPRRRSRSTISISTSSSGSTTRWVI